ncbi:MAG: enoyl-CoA hydratase-related protein [Desulfitobacteriaceae bacterium]
MSNTVAAIKKNGVGYLTLNRPDTSNALNKELVSEIIHGIEGLIADDGVRVIVIRAEGKAFCVGGDLAEMSEVADPGTVLKELTFLLNRVIVDICRSPKPIIAAVGGAAAGAGMSLAMACDLCFAASSAKFRQAYTSNGLVPDGGWTLWATAVLGLNRARELAFLDPVISSDEALKWGLVHRVFPDNELENAVQQQAERMAKGASFAYAQAKELLSCATLSILETQLERERRAMTAASSSHDGIEGIKAFLEKRIPRFSGS